MTQIVGILLAAGQGSRFGSDKLLHPLKDGTPMALVAARHLRPACNRLFAVLRPDSATLAGLLAAEGYETIICPDAEAGMRRALDLLADPAHREAVAAAGMAFATTHQGATARSVAILANLRNGALRE